MKINFVRCCVLVLAIGLSAIGPASQSLSAAPAQVAIPEIEGLITSPSISVSRTFPVGFAAQLQVTSIRLAGMAVTAFTTVDAGNGHTCALTDHGGVKCWGANPYGQLGDGTQIDHYTPAYVNGLTEGVIAITAGSTHTCAVTNSGGVKCWGHNNHGQLGDGTTLDSTTPVDVSGLASDVTAIDAGNQYTCALMSNGGAKCWGLNYNGLLGDGTSADRHTPVDVSGLTSGVIAIRGSGAGGGHTCALTDGGGVKCWGWNAYGQLGDGTTVNRYTPVQVSGLTSGARDVALGTWSTCAVIDGGVKCWGENEYGQLGDGTTTNRSTPVDVSGLTGGVTALAAGFGYACALTDEGGVKCWGANSAGALGDGTTTNWLTPVEVSGLAGNAIAITAKSHHTCALIAGGDIQCWGDNSAGQLGNGLSINHTMPTDVNELTSNVTNVALGYHHVCALVNHGVECWGDNGFGQLGAGTTITHTPIDVSGLMNGVTALSAGSLHTCALTDSGGVKCWGDNRSGQLGDGSTINQFTPIDVSGLISDVVSIAAGGQHTCALTGSGGVKCWGANHVGACTASTSLTPVDVCGLTSGVTAIAAGYDHTCALTVGGGVKCWGSTPVDVDGLTSGVQAIAAGGSHTCAILNDGTVQCWGNNAAGQLGDGTVGDVRTLAAGDMHTCALTNNGGLQCWGSNAYGQLGDGSLNNSVAPRNVIGLTSGVSAVAAGYEQTCAITSGGSLKCWGNNDYDMLGDGSLPYSPNPVYVLNPEWHIYLPLVQHNYTAPRASFIADPVSGLAPLSVSFNNTSTGSSFTSTWDFGDGVTSTLTSPSHTYQFTGTYTATLAVSDGSATDTAVATINVDAGRELLINGGFEQGQRAWLWNGYPDHANVITTVVHSGLYAAKLGIEPPDPLQYSYATATYPIGVLPAAPHTRLSFWYWPRREGLAGDPAHSRQFAYVLSGDKILQKLFEFDEDLSGWQYAEFDLSKYAGESIAIQFGVYHDGNLVYDKRSALYVDDVSLTIDAEPFPIYQLAAYYPFSGDAQDASGNGNDGIVTGASLTTDRFGHPDSAYHFDGIDDYISVRYDSSLSFPHDMTAAAWIQTTDDAGGIAHEHNGYTDGNFVFGLSQGGKFRFGRSAILVSGQYDSQFVSDDRWHFVVGVYDDTHHLVKHYIDGALVQSYEDLQSLPDYHLALIIGDENNHLYAFNGVIDDVRLYSRALSDAEIWALWSANP